jgi:hypothetical protein
MQNVWYYPNEVYGDKELLSKARYVKSDGDYGKAAQIQLFSGRWVGTGAVEEQHFQQGRQAQD